MSQDKSLESRITELEQEVAELRKHLAALSSQPLPQSSPAPAEPAPGTLGAPTAESALPPVPRTTTDPFKRGGSGFNLPASFRSGEFWLNKAGIGLLLFGLVFLFKYSIDQGWITPPLRIVAGAGLGIVLIALGLRLHGRRLHFSRVLMGGGIASLYITIFAAHQLFGMVAFGAAAGLMAAVTAVSFVLSVRQDDAVLALLGALGGLGSPLLLYTESGTLTGLAAYFIVVLAGTSAIYFAKGWRSLLWLSVVGGWMVVWTGLVRVTMNPFATEQWTVQITVFMCVFSFWLVPVIRELVWAGDQKRWPRPIFEFIGSGVSQSMVNAFDRQVHALTLSTPLLALGTSSILWDLPNTTWGYLCLAVAGVLALTALVLRRSDILRKLAITHLLTSLGFFTLALSLIFDGNTLFIALTIEAAILQVIAWQVRDTATSVCSGVLFLFLAGWFLTRLTLTPETQPFLNADTLSEIPLMISGLVLYRFAHARLARPFFFLLGYAILIGITTRELTDYTNALFVVLTLEISLLHVVGALNKDTTLSLAANLGTMGLAMLFGWRLATFPADSPAMLNRQALADLLFVASLVLTFRLCRVPRASLVWSLVAHAAVLALTYREFCTLANGQALVSGVWGLYAIVLLVIGLRLNHVRIRQLSLATLGLIVAKLFVVDLAYVRTIWRVLLFAGFGAAFLVLSYYFRSLWKDADDDPGSTGI